MVEVWAAESHPCPPSLQRVAYGITPENEHHLVAQRDVRQFKVDEERTWGVAGQDRVGSGCFPWSAQAESQLGRAGCLASFCLGAKVAGAQSACCCCCFLVLGYLCWDVPVLVYLGVVTLASPN